MPRRQHDTVHRAFAHLRNRVRFSSRAKGAQQRGGRIRRPVRFGPVAREAIERSEPDTALTIAEKELGVARREAARGGEMRSEEHTSELQSLRHLVCRL